MGGVETVRGGSIIEKNIAGKEDEENPSQIVRIRVRAEKMVEEGGEVVEAIDAHIKENPEDFFYPTEERLKVLSFDLSEYLDKKGIGYYDPVLIKSIIEELKNKEKSN